MGTWLHQEELVGEVSCSWELRVFPTLLTPGGEVSEPEVSEPWVSQEPAAGGAAATSLEPEWVALPFLICGYKHYISVRMGHSNHNTASSLASWRPWLHGANFLPLPITRLANHSHRAQPSGFHRECSFNCSPVQATHIIPKKWPKIDGRRQMCIEIMHMWSEVMDRDAENEG